MNEIRVLSGLAPLVVILLAAPVRAGEADVVAAKVTPERGGRYRFEVTVQHADEGWGHYADRWEVLDAEGHVLARRELRHPHVNEQPFTRALSEVELPKGTVRVRVRAHDSDHGYGGAEIDVDVSAPGGAAPSTAP